MAEETSRTRSVRRITAPGDTGTYIDLKVIDTITFKEEKQPYQEWVLGFKNNPDDASRTVHVVEVGKDLPTGSGLKIERIDTLETEETTAKHQEAIWAFLNSDEPPVHLKTHKKKIYASDGKGNVTDTGTWIEVQRIDEIEFEDPKDVVRNQEFVWTLKNPDLEDTDDDYKDLPNPTTDWDGTTINPPWRLDPFQTITDCSFGRYLLVLYESNKIAAVKINEKGSFDVVKKKTLASSSWGSNYLSAWYPAETLPNFFLKTAQIKISKTLHALTCGIEIDNGVIKSCENQELRPVYNVTDTIHKYAKNQTLFSDAYGWTAERYGPCVDPIINGSGDFVWTETLEKYQATKNGIVRIDNGQTEALTNDVLTWNQHVSAVGSNGERYSAPVLNNFFVTLNYYSVAYGGFLPYNDAQLHSYTALTEGTYPFPGEPIPYTFFTYGPSNECAGILTEETYGGSGGSSSTGKVLNHAKSNGLDVIGIGTFDVAWTWERGDGGVNNHSITVDGDYYFGSIYSQPSDLIYTFSFPYIKKGQRIYKRVRNYLGGGLVNYTYTTPYETYDSPTWSNEPTGDEPGLIGWLHVSNGKHTIQGYIMNGEKRLFLNDADKGSVLSGAIGCDLQDIVTVIMDVKMSDIDKLK